MSEEIRAVASICTLRERVDDIARHSTRATLLELGFEFRGEARSRRSVAPGEIMTVTDDWPLIRDPGLDLIRLVEAVEAEEAIRRLGRH